MMETMNSQATSAAHVTADKIAMAVDEAAEKVKPAMHRAADAAQVMVDKAVSAVEPTTEWLTEQARSLKVSQQKMMDETTKYVAANPLKSMGAALAVGLLISRLMR